ncbi:MAG: hypothetical protein ACK4IX_16975, partial [Candidatus Sericytochromatia bacterium]
LKISEENSILEIGTKFNNTFQDLFPDFKKITLFDHWIYRENENNIKEQEKLIENKKFDYIVFNFSLEQMINPYEKLKYFVENNLSENGKVLIFIKNPQFVGNILNFLSKSWSNISNGYKNQDNYNLISINELKNEISIKLNLSLVQKNLKEDVTPYADFYNKFLPVLSSKLNLNEFINNSDISNYVFIAGKK